MARHQARETALQALYEIEVGSNDKHTVLERLVQEKNYNREDTGFLKQLVLGVVENFSVLDNIISRFSRGWEVERLSFVDKNILRLALYEMLYITEIPRNASINEAVELAKTFGGADSPRFVNGLLDNVKSEDLAGDTSDT